MESWYWFLGFALITAGLVLRFVFCRHFGPIIKQTCRDKVMLEHLTPPERSRVYLGIYGCLFPDSPPAAVIKKIILTEHSPKPCGIFLARVISREPAGKQDIILEQLVKRLREMPHEYRTKFVGSAKDKTREYSNQESVEIGKRLLNMLDQALPGWQEKD